MHIRPPRDVFAVPAAFIGEFGDIGAECLPTGRIGTYGGNLGVKEVCLADLSILKNGSSRESSERCIRTEKGKQLHPESSCKRNLPRSTMAAAAAGFGAIATIYAGVNPRMQREGATLP